MVPWTYEKSLKWSFNLNEKIGKVVVVGMVADRILQRKSGRAARRQGKQILGVVRVGVSFASLFVSGPSDLWRCPMQSRKNITCKRCRGKSSEGRAGSHVNAHSFRFFFSLHCQAFLPCPAHEDPCWSPPTKMTLLRSLLHYSLQSLLRSFPGQIEFSSIRGF